MTFQFVLHRAVCAGALLVGLSASRQAQAATLTVTSTADTVAVDGVLTLREAMQSVNNNVDVNTDATANRRGDYINPSLNYNEIIFDATVFAHKQSIHLVNGQLPAIVNQLLLTGPKTLGAGVSIMPNDFGMHGILSIRTGGGGSVNNLTFQGGGGAVSSAGGSTIFNNCTFSNNTVAASHLDTGHPFQQLVFNNCTFAYNSYAAVLCQSGDMSLHSCTIASNLGTGILIHDGNVSLRNSLVVGQEQNIVNQSANSFAIDVDEYSIVTGSAAAAGLRNNGMAILADNGGPTETIALVSGSPAINMGSSFLGEDQRFLLRDSNPDIGAYEANTPPRVVSVSPTIASDKVGNTRTFTVVVRDPNGVGDISQLRLLINTSQYEGEGACLVYLPRQFDSNAGELLLQGNPLSSEGLTQSIRLGGVGNPPTVLDNGAIRIASSDVSVSTSPDQRTLTLTVTATIRDGLVGDNRIYASVMDRADFAAGRVPPYLRTGTYTVTPRFSDGVNDAPTLSKLTPGATYTTLNSFGIAPAAQTFNFFVKDEDGLGDVQEVWFLAGKQRGWKNSAAFVFYPRTRRLVLRSDDGNQFQGGGVIGSFGTLENSQVFVDLSKVKMLVYPDGKSFGLSLPIRARKGLLGQNKIWLRVQDNQGVTAPNGDDQGYVLSGTWTVNPPKTTPPAASAKPSGGNS